jgi:hypothetical protein
VSLALAMKVSSVAMNTDSDSNSTQSAAFINLCSVIPHTCVLLCNIESSKWLSIVAMNAGANIKILISFAHVGLLNTLKLHSTLFYSTLSITTSSIWGSGKTCGRDNRGVPTPGARAAKKDDNGHPEDSNNGKKRLKRTP